MTLIQTKAYFDSDIKPQIIELLKTAKQEVFVASAWFNDEELYDALVALPRTVKTKVLIKKDDERNTLDWMNLGDCGIKVYQLVQESEGRSLMHHKFCVIDNEIVITGSYNWTNGANYSNFENVVVIQGDTKLNFEFKEKFKTLIQPIIEFFESKKQLLIENANSHIDKVRAKTEAHIEEVKKVEKWVLDYMEKYNEMPPEQLTNQQFSKEYRDTSASDIGKGIVVYGSAVTTHNTSLSTSEAKKDWWENKLSNDLKSYFYKEKFQLNIRHTDYPGDEAINNLLEFEGLSIQGISSANGLEYLINLKNLYIKGNFYELPNLSQLEFLTSLNITSFSLEKLPNLENLKYLKTLNITDSRISSLEEIPVLNNLTSVSCYNTPILTLKGIEKLPNLREIYCDKKFIDLPREEKRLNNLGFIFNEKLNEKREDKGNWHQWYNEERRNKIKADKLKKQNK